MVLMYNVAQTDECRVTESLKSRGNVHANKQL